MSGNDLEFVSSAELIIELQKRHDEMVLVGASKRTSDIEDLTVSFSGSYHCCIGLIEVGKIALLGGTGEEHDID